MRLASIIARLEKHRKKAKELAKKDISNYFIFTSLAMECFQAVNSAIELANILFLLKNWDFHQNIEKYLSYCMKIN